MLYRELTSWDKNISRITFGGASLSGEGGGYGFGEMSEEESERLLKAAWDAGITVFDTAPIYGFGLSEERLGRYLPQDAMVITKSGVDWHETKRVNMSNTKAITEKMLSESLRRLRRETIDLYMIHWPDPKVDVQEPMEVLAKAKKEGKIKRIGLCNTTLEDLIRASEVEVIDAVQSELNLFTQEPFLRLGDSWRDKFSMSWGTFDKGILTGRVSHERKFSVHDARSWAPWWNKKEVSRKIDKTIKLKNILEHFDLSLTEFCLQHNLNFGVTSCLIGFKSVEDITEVCSHLQRQISNEIIKEVLEIWNLS